MAVVLDHLGVEQSKYPVRGALEAVTDAFRSASLATAVQVGSS